MNLFRIGFLFLIAISLWQCTEDASEKNNSTSSDTTVDNLPPEQEDFGEAQFKWGYINQAGSLVIPTRFDDARNFEQGLAAVQVKGEWGFINKQGEYVIEPQFKGVWAFQEGLARALTWEGEI